jgi:hypothetical protein
MVRVMVGLGVVATISMAHAESVDPTKLATLPAPAKGTGDTVAVFAAGVDADMVLYALGTSDFVMVADAKPIDGRLGDPTGVPATAAFDALAKDKGVIRLHRSHSPHAIDLDLHHASPLELLRLVADTESASYVFAPQHDLATITIRARRADPREVAHAVAKLVGLELVESHGVWAVVEPGTKLDPKLAAITHARSRLAIDHAHPGEARRLLEPDEPQERNLCPKDTLIDANLHGQSGVLDAVLATITGPPCEQQPNHGELDTATATLVGILVEPKLRRAVFRVPHGARAFEPADGQERVEISYVMLKGDTTATLRPPSSDTQTPGPFAADDAHAWKLRGTVRVGKTWRAIFRSATAWRVVPGPNEAKVEITAGTATGKTRAFTLER